MRLFFKVFRLLGLCFFLLGPEVKVNNLKTLKPHKRSDLKTL